MTFKVCNGPSPVAMALFDLPWTLVLILGIFIFHPYLGYLAIAGGIILVIVAIANQFTSKVPLQNANEATFHAETMGEQMRSGADTIQALDMRKAAFQRWIDLRNKSLRAGIKAAIWAAALVVCPRRSACFYNLRCWAWVPILCLRAN